jgi:GntR family carbon starvation induced transcriptional regulator
MAIDSARARHRNAGGGFQSADRSIEDAADASTSADDRLEGSTLAETAYLRLRKDIVQGNIAPSEKLRVEWLRDSYGIGASPLREALSRLTSSGLVIAKGKQGFYVAPVGVPDLLDLTKTRVWAQTLAVRAAVADGDREWEARIVAAAHRLDQNPADIGLDAWDMYHTELHEAMIAGCGSPRLLAHCANLQDLSDRYRWLALKQAKRVRNLKAEHDALVEALLDRNAKLASKLIEEHLLQTTEILLPLTETRAGAAALMAKLRTEIRLALPT